MLMLLLLLIPFVIVGTCIMLYKPKCPSCGHEILDYGQFLYCHKCRWSRMV